MKITGFLFFRAFLRHFSFFKAQNGLKVFLSFIDKLNINL
ncbi:hypothetical protein VVMO6_03112 [Vibrio vulnificus MO6-24/O]|nr:hypothetical protein VVMO6_03112 [Vibrio vulnificus MO6-24/O]